MSSKVNIEVVRGCPLFPADKPEQHSDIYNEICQKVRVASDFVNVRLGDACMWVTHYGTRKFRYPLTLTVEWVASKVAWMEKNNI